MTPETMIHGRLELFERHVGLAIAVLPVIAHLAPGIAHPGAVVDEDRRPDRPDLRGDQRLDEVPRHTSGRAGEVSEPEGTGRHAVIVLLPRRGVSDAAGR